MRNKHYISYFWQCQHEDDFCIRSSVQLTSAKMNGQPLIVCRIAKGGEDPDALTRRALQKEQERKGKNCRKKRVARYRK